MAKSNVLSKRQIEIIAETASQEAIKAYEKKAKKVAKELKNRNLRNTELLLKNYIKLKDQCEEIIQDVVPEGSPEFSLETLTLETLSIYKAKTLKMMEHVDKMLIAYEWNSKKGSVEEYRRYQVLKKRYLSEDKLNVKEICETFNIEQGTVYRDTKLAIKDMSVLLFGIDAIDFN
ncbi:helix-turn-helix domain containing protein [Vagococcus fluvialis]|uniref:helix-turn-helix domain-containing protein n=1 Tax=Vagococcus fluvialis TaxID=2738 RepID=UPI0028900F61|nr:helix-turn-helix domain-containing protein [Vagococcus fluvialis]MDT2781401.1 helix-turn-helix domain containing protein [Vagococcus fluvialis]